MNHLVHKRVYLAPFFVVCVVILVAMVTLGYYLQHTSYQRYIADLTRLARSGAEMIHLLGPRPTIVAFDDLTDSFAANSRFRATIIDMNGRVLGDSRLSLDEVREIENHADRPEVIMAKESGTGISRRHSSTLNIDLLYVAVRYSSRGEKGVFRVALPLTELAQDNLKRQLALALVGAVALCLAGLLIWLASRHLIALVEQGQQQLERRVSDRTMEIEILQNLGTQLTACNSKDEALEVVKLISTILFPDISGSVALYRSSKNLVEHKISWNGDWQGDNVYEPDQCWALRTGQVHIGDTATGTMACSHARAGHGRLICVPLVAQGVTHGVLHLAIPEGKTLGPDKEQLANTVAEHTSLALANLELRESLRQQAIRDPLTGLYNRRYLNEAFEHEMSRAVRRTRQLGLLMIDLDHFKSINDRYGHEAGDYVLSEVGLLLRKMIRSEDIPCRYGGEEFAVLLPETGGSDAQKVALKLCEQMRQREFHLNGKVLGCVTLSIGVAAFPDNADNITALQKRADEALYEAKKGGRDRVVLSS